MAAAPDYIQMVKNLTDSLPSIFSIIRTFIWLSSVFFVYSGIMDFLQSTEKNSKFFSGGKQPTYMAGIVKIILAGFAFTLSDNLFLIGTASSLFMPDGFTPTSIISLQSYVPQVNESEDAKYMKILLIGVMQAVGIVACFQGLRILMQNAEGTAKTSVSHGLMYIFFGALCYQVVWVHYTIANTIGFDIGALLGLSIN